ncbi:MAG: LPS-assembly protein LptD [Alphaproteobacteria bacterium]|nr:LPS-assembly protein LptD [Alphaproteobacteria bacterium]
MCKKIILILILMFSFCLQAKAIEPVAGEKIKKQETMPYIDMEPQYNITDVIPSSQSFEEEPDIYFVADELTSNDNESILEAMGNVVIKRANLTLYTDKLIYEQLTDNITAIGNVRLEEKSGHVIYADKVNLADKMSKAEMNKIKVILSDETKIWAEQFRKKENDNKIMRKALYTPCDFCEGNEKPLWQIRARKVTHDAKRKDINYNDAFLDIKGIPVLYTPFLSHPDPTVRRRSGFLTPNIGSSNYLGGTLEIKYFWDINQNSDLLLSPIFTTDKDVVFGGRYRQYFNHGYLSLEGTYLNDDDKERATHRGNVSAKTRYEINDFWVADADINYASDSLYLRELDLDGEDDAWLTSNIRLQRFESRNYALIEALYYKLVSYDLRENNASEYARMKYNKPLVAPLAEYETISDISKIGSYWKNIFNFASVYHEGNNLSHRLTMINSWNLPWISPFGEKYKIVASVKSDAYYVDGYSEVGTSRDFDGDVFRVFPQLGIEWKLPFVKATENSRQIIEPIIVGVLAPNGGNKINRIPNEDSEDVELDDTNVLDLDRYSGYDRNDTGSRISYGLNWSSYGNIMGRTSAFVAQTYQFNKESSFSNSIENEGHFSDYVGRIYAAPANYLDLNYRFRLDKDSYKLQYSELGAKIGTDLLNMYVSYIYLQKNNNATELFDERKELYTSIHAALTRDWSISVYNRQDLADNGGSLEHGGNLVYEDECFKFITTIKKYNSNDPSLDDDYEFNFTFYLKTLGGIGA